MAFGLIHAGKVSGKPGDEVCGEVRADGRPGNPTSRQDRLPRRQVQDEEFLLQPGRQRPPR